MRLRLGGNGYQVITCSSGADALEWLAQSKAHLIICDVMMSQMSGIDFLKKLAEKQNDIPVLMLTAGRTDLEEELYALGAKAVLLKHDPKEKFFGKIEELLG